MGQLANRERLGLILPKEMVAWLKEKSEETGTPISRIVEKMIEPHMKD